MISADALVAAVDISKRGAGLGIVGGIVFTAIVISAILLLRNMNQRINRLPQDMGEADAPSDATDGSHDAQS